MRTSRRTSSRRRGILGVFAAAFAALCIVLAVPAVASALSLEDVKAMSSSGSIDDNTIINIINNSNQSFDITPEVEKELKKAGVSDRVIKALKATSAGTTGTGDAGGTTDGPEPLPATAGNLGKIAAQAARTAKQKFDIESETNKRLAEEERMKAIQAELDLAFQKVDTVIRDFDSTDKWSALATCHNFLAEFQPPKSTDEYYLATWCKGQAFNDLRLHNLAAPILREVAALGAERPKFQEAFGALVESANAAEYYPPALAELDKLYVEDKSREFQDEYNYFLGKFFQNVLRDYERSIALFSNVSSDHELHAKALYNMGVMQASPELNQYKTAVGNFQNAIVSAEGESELDDKEDILELAYLALARIAYEANNYDGALYYYNKVDRRSQRYPQALFEQAWTYFQKGDARNALGTFHSVSSPYYDGYYFPDLWVLEAATYLNLCRYELAKEALQTFQDLYLAKLPLLQQFIAAQADPAKIFDNVVKAIEQGDDGPLPAIFGEAILANVRFYDIYKTISQLDRELARLQKAKDNLGPYGEELLAKLEAAAETKRFEAGIETQNILRGIEEDLNNWDVTATEVSIEIDIDEKELQERCLQLAAQGKPCEFTTEEETVLFLVADDWQFWPFEGEYWVDEVGNYKSYLGDRCRQVDALAGAGGAEGEATE